MRVNESDPHGVRRRPLWATIQSALAFGGLSLLAFSCAMTMPVIEAVPFAALADGTYRGTHETTLVTAEMEAKLAAGVMTGLKVIRHECGLGKPAEAIVDRVLQAQSLEVDAVSGATFSSKVILKAVETALRQGPID